MTVADGSLTRRLAASLGAGAGAAAGLLLYFQDRDHQP